MNANRLRRQGFGNNILTVVRRACFRRNEIKTGTQATELLRELGIKKGQTVLDFGCGFGAFTIPAAKIVGAQGKVYALDKDKEALDTLMRRAKFIGLKNIERMETSGEPEIELDDKSIDAVFLFNVFHSFYFPKAADRRRLLVEIRRIMKPSALLSISVWPNLIEPGTEDEITNANFHLEKMISEGVGIDNNALGTRRIVNFRKERSVLSITNQSKRR